MTFCALRCHVLNQSSSLETVVHPVHHQVRILWDLFLCTLSFQRSFFLSHSFLLSFVQGTHPTYLRATAQQFPGTSVTSRLTRGCMQPARSGTRICLLLVSIVVPSVHAPRSLFKSSARRVSTVHHLPVQKVKLFEKIQWTVAKDVLPSQWELSHPLINREIRGRQGLPKDQMICSHLVVSFSRSITEISFPDSYFLPFSSHFLTGCKFKGRIYANGDQWHPMIGSYGEIKCVKCHCKDGRQRCKHLKCPQLTCSKQISLPSECCPRCAPDKEATQWTIHSSTH